MCIPDMPGQKSRREGGIARSGSHRTAACWNERVMAKTMQEPETGRQSGVS